MRRITRLMPRAPRQRPKALSAMPSPSRLAVASAQGNRLAASPSSVMRSMARHGISSAGSRSRLSAPTAGAGMRTSGTRSCRSRNTRSRSCWRRYSSAADDAGAIACARADSAHTASASASARQQRASTCARPARHGRAMAVSCMSGRCREPAPRVFANQVRNGAVHADPIQIL